MLTGFKRTLRAGFVGFWRNAFVSAAAIFVMTITIFVIGATLLLEQLLNASLQNITDKVDINVYFVTEAVEEDIFALQTSIEALPEVAGTSYTSREEALSEFRERHRTDEQMIQALEELGENPLGASLAIRARETSQYEGIAAFLDEKQNLEASEARLIDNVTFEKNRDAIERLTAILEAVENAGLAVMIVLIIAAVFITFNTIRLAIYTSREEIRIMRLVGASNMFIRGPFLLQGMMYGLTAGVLGLLILYPIVLWIGPATQQFFQFDVLSYFVGNFAQHFGILVGIGVVLGLLSSLLAISRYLRA